MKDKERDLDWKIKKTVVERIGKKKLCPTFAKVGCGSIY